MHALIVEDNEDIQSLLYDILIKINISPHICWTIHEGLAYYRDHPVDLIIIDHDLPDGTGLELIQTFKQMGPKVPPFILATATARFEIAVQAIRLGVRDYIVKDNEFVSNMQRAIGALQKKQADYQPHHGDGDGNSTAHSSLSNSKQYLANLSHEIRTPLNSIIGLVDCMADTPLNDFQRKCILNTRSCAYHLFSVVGNVLDYSKIEAGKLDVNYTKTDLLDLIHDVKAIVEPSTPRRTIGIVLDIEQIKHATVRTDPVRLKQILINLLNNAIKFTRCGFVEFTLIEKTINGHESAYTFYINDKGVGLDEEQQKRLFHSYEQLDMANAYKLGGTGLGLVICKQYIELLGGKLFVQSTVGEGSSFYFTLHMTYPKKTSANRSPSPPLPVIKKTDPIILIVDDDDTNLLMLRLLIQKYFPQAVIHEAKDGQEGIDKASQHHVDIVFMDIMMPDIDGIKATSEIRHFNRDLPIVALTADADQTDKTNSLRAGMNDYLTKPIRKDVLFDIINRFATRPTADETER